MNFRTPHELVIKLDLIEVAFIQSACILLGFAVNFY